SETGADASGGVDQTQGAGDALGGDGQPGDADAHRVLDGVGDRGGRWGDGRLADPARAEGPEALARLDHDGLDVGNVARARDQVGGERRGEVHAVLDDDLFHQRVAEPLHRAALDLALDRLRVDGAADVVGGHELQHADHAGLGVDLHLGGVAAERVVGK